MSLSVLMFAGLVAACSAMPGGAPASQCGSFLPSHGSSAQPADTNPFEISLNNFPVDEDNTTRTFLCGGSYPVIITGVASDNDFRGFLIQARLIENGAPSETPFGTFTGLPIPLGNSTVAMARVGDCLPAGSSATHVQPGPANRADRVDVSYVSLTWYAPVEGCTGGMQVRFRYTVVQVLSTWWGPQYSAPLTAAASASTAMVTFMISMILLSLGLMY